MKRYFLLSSLVWLILIACSKDDAELQELNLDDDSELQKVNLDDDSELQEVNPDDNFSLFETNFLPTFTNYYGRDNGSHAYRSASLAVKWDHEYDDQGRLIKSTMYEKFPSRILKEISFLDYSSDNLEVNIQVEIRTYFLNFPNVYTFNSRLQLNEDFSINRIIPRNSEGEYSDGHYLSFDEFNSQKWVTKVGDIVGGDKKLWTTNYEYDEEGNVTRYYTTYEYEMADANVDYTYTYFGDPKTYYFQNEKGTFSKVNYYYREDNTLERLEEDFDWGNGDTGKNIYIYTHEEAFQEKITTKEDGSQTIVRYEYFEGETIVKYYDGDGVISDTFQYLMNNEIRYLSAHEKYQNGILRSKEYFDIDCDLIKKEFFDENGVLEYTEYYDEGGNYTHTEYASTNS